MNPQNVTMPRWPAYLMGAFAAACAYPAVTMPSPTAETYRALGQEPGWNLVIGRDRIDYVGDYGETRISVGRPEPRATANGRRYEAGRLLVDIRYDRCNDAMSGHGYEHQVTVTADGTTVHGCGGPRRTDWDV
jgi:heat shock protein HslJ